jgi:P-type E1-E2 ATPase
LTVPSQFQETAGRGVSAGMNGNRVLVGRRAWLRDEGIEPLQEAETRAAALEATGHTVLSVAVNQRLVGLIALRDTLRPEAKDTISRLNAQGVRVAMLTGDNERAAQAMAEEAGIVEVHPNLLPDDKLRLVREWQARGLRVAFIGDGINDAPALAAADVGIAMGVAGTDVAMETSDIGFLSDDLTRMPEVVELSRRMLRVIAQNVAFSVAVNLGSVVAAGMGWISPIAGAVIHETSAMAVIVNAMRLLR